MLMCFLPQLKEKRTLNNKKEYSYVNSTIQWSGGNHCFSNIEKSDAHFLYLFIL